MSDIVLGEADDDGSIVAEADPNAPQVDPEVRKAHLAAAEDLMRGREALRPRMPVQRGRQPSRR